MANLYYKFSSLDQHIALLFSFPSYQISYSLYQFFCFFYFKETFKFLHFKCKTKKISNGHIILRYSLALLLWYMSRCFFCTFSFLIVSRSLVLIFSLLFMSLKNNKKIVGNTLIFPLKYTTLPASIPILSCLFCNSVDEISQVISKVISSTQAWITSSGTPQRLLLQLFPLFLP